MDKPEEIPDEDWDILVTGVKVLHLANDDDLMAAIVAIYKMGFAQGGLKAVGELKIY